MTVPSTTEEKICKKNDVKAKSLLLMALPNEHQLTFNQYADAQSMFIAIKARFGGNDATKKTQKALLKQQYENFNATSSESLDFIFNRLQKACLNLFIEDPLSKIHDDDLEENTSSGIWEYGAGFDWSDMAENEIQANMALMAFTDSEDSSLKSTTVCNRESNNSRENTDDSLPQQPKTVIETSSVVSVNTARPFSTARSVNPVRPYYTAHPKSTVSCARPKTHIQNQAHSTVQRPFYKSTTLTKRSNNQNINTGRQTVNTVRPNVNTVRARGFNAVKPSACWVWRPIKPNGASLSNSQLNEKGFVDSGCSRHMSGNIAHLSDFKEFDGGYVTFGGGANGGRITGKGTIKTDKLDFEDVYFVKELKFNLFSVSQMCDKKNYVLFTDSECLVLSPNFKLPDENQILLKIPRHNNMYSFDMKNIVPKDGLTCLVAKATSEIPIDPNDQEKTTFTCPFRTYAYRRIPFGLCNAPATFQSVVKMLILSTKNWEKCHFMVKEEIMLRHKVSSAGLEADREKIDVISKLLPPTNIKEFDIEIKDRKGTENITADHLSRIENDKTSDDNEVDENFPRETLMEIPTTKMNLLGLQTLQTIYRWNYTKGDDIPTKE
ncbi:hypothetical protein Tco_0053387 [Tanacetum coccineum]